MTYPSDLLSTCPEKRLVNEGAANLVDPSKPGVCVVLDANGLATAKSLILKGVKPEDIIIPQADPAEAALMEEEAIELGVQLWNMDMYNALDFASHRSIKLLSIDSCGWWYSEKGKFKCVHAILEKACKDKKLADGCVIRMTVYAKGRGALTTDECIMDMLGISHTLANEGQYMYQAYPADMWSKGHGMAYVYGRRGGEMVNMIGKVYQYTK
jgi:hypothetical protein